MIQTGHIKIAIGGRALLTCIAVVATSWARADGGYLVLSGGVARTRVVPSPGNAAETQKVFRIAAGMDFNPTFGLEVGVATAGAYTPPPQVVLQRPGARLKITTIDLAVAARYSPADRVRIFAALGPAFVSTRTELPVARGPATTLTSSKELTWRAAIGLDFAVSDHTAIQMSAARLGSIGSNTGVDGTGRSRVDCLLAGVLVQF